MEGDISRNKKLFQKIENFTSYIFMREIFSQNWNAIAFNGMAIIARKHTKYKHPTKNR